MKAFGIEMYDFSARMYDPQLGRTWQPDPMADKRVWMSPYSWVQNDPVNRIDPSGAIDGPVFWSSGDYRGLTSDGIQGNIIVYDGNLNFEKMTEKELLESGDGAKTFDQKQEEMDNNTEAHLLTNLAGLAEGMDVKGRAFTMKSLIGEK